MYAPPHFREDRVPVLYEAIARSGLATLVTFGPDGLDASHVPMVLDRAAGPLGTLYGHLARANRQWQGAAPDLPALAIFLGPDAYVTPSWYATKLRTGKVAPTWNYVAIHAQGQVRFFDEPERLLTLVTKLTEAREAARTEPWAVSDAPEDFVRERLQHLVGFELHISRVEGKWKMSQNRPAEDQAGVLDGLEREGGAAGEAVAGIMRAVRSSASRSGRS